MEERERLEWRKAGIWMNGEGKGVDRWRRDKDIWMGLGWDGIRHIPRNRIIIVSSDIYTRVRKTRCRHPIIVGRGLGSRIWRRGYRRRVCILNVSFSPFPPSRSPISYNGIYRRGQGRSQMLGWLRSVDDSWLIVSELCSGDGVYTDER